MTGSSSPRKQEVDGHYLYAVCCNCRVNALVIYVCRSFQAIHFRDGRSCDIGIKDTNLVALFCFLVCQRCGYHGFTNTALAADNANDMFDRRIGIQINMKSGLPCPALLGHPSQLSLEQLELLHSFAMFLSSFLVFLAYLTKRSIALFSS